MVREVKKNNKLIYFCEVYGAAYDDKEWAQKCQEWCETHHGSCNIEIIKHSVQL